MIPFEQQPPLSGSRPRPEWVRGSCPECGDDLVSNLYYVGGKGRVVRLECWGSLQKTLTTCNYVRLPDMDLPIENTEPLEQTNLLGRPAEPVAPANSAEPLSIAALRSRSDTALAVMMDARGRMMDARERALNAKRLACPTFPHLLTIWTDRTDHYYECMDRYIAAMEEEAVALNAEQMMVADEAEPEAPGAAGRAGAYAAASRPGRFLRSSSSTGDVSLPTGSGTPVTPAQFRDFGHHWEVL